MRFRTTHAVGMEAPEPTIDPEAARVRIWQLERLNRIGYDSRSASRIVAAAWDEGDHADLVHRIEDLLGRGATLDQAARIVMPIGAPHPEPEGGADAEG